MTHDLLLSSLTCRRLLVSSAFTRHLQGIQLSCRRGKLPEATARCREGTGDAKTRSSWNSSFRKAGAPGVGMWSVLYLNLTHLYSSSVTVLCSLLFYHIAIFLWKHQRETSGVAVLDIGKLALSGAAPYVGLGFGLLTPTKTEGSSSWKAEAVVMFSGVSREPWKAWEANLDFQIVPNSFPLPTIHNGWQMTAFFYIYNLKTKCGANCVCLKTDRHFGFMGVTMNIGDGLPLKVS